MWDWLLQDESQRSAWFLLWADLCTEIANRLQPPKRIPLDLSKYPAHLHIGVLPDWRRQRIGTALMSHFSQYLRRLGVSGYHLYASDYNFMGENFYQKLVMNELGKFKWKYHNSKRIVVVTEYVFGKMIDTPTPWEME
jgi:GNAT superfamily N-acetyltransferase